MTMKEKNDVLFVNEELPYDGWVENLLKEYPAENAGWSIFKRNGETAFVWNIDDNLMTGREIPCYSKRDPWNRPIRNWKFFENDEPNVWLPVDDMQRQSFEVPTNAIQYTWTSINNRCFCLYLIQ